MLSKVYGFWKYVSKLGRRETRRYIEMFYILKFRELVCAYFTSSLFKGTLCRIFNALDKSHCSIIVLLLVEYFFSKINYCALVPQVKTVPIASDDTKSLKEQEKKV